LLLRILLNNYKLNKFNTTMTDKIILSTLDAKSFPKGVFRVHAIRFYESKLNKKFNSKVDAIQNKIENAKEKALETVKEFQKDISLHSKEFMKLKKSGKKIKKEIEKKRVQQELLTKIEKEQGKLKLKTEIETTIQLIQKYNLVVPNSVKITKKQLHAFEAGEDSDYEDSESNEEIIVPTNLADHIIKKNKDIEDTKIAKAEFETNAIEWLFKQITIKVEDGELKVSGDNDLYNKIMYKS